MIHISETIISQQKNYQNQLCLAIEEGWSPVEFKKYGGGMGVYPQKDKDLYMVRPRLYSGIVSVEQLSLVAELSDKYAKGPLHLTTRQSIQIHHLLLSDTGLVIQELLDNGIITVGTGGNSIRNISCPPLAGVDPHEVFDVTPYVLQATEYALGLEGMNTLPRKYKIAFSGDDRDLAKAKLSDLGFIAKEVDGQRYFQVFGGGGVGSNPKTAILLHDNLPVSKVLIPILAMKKLFEDHGDRTNRNKARIRYIVERLGSEAFIKLYMKYFNELYDEVPDLKKVDDEVLPIGESLLEPNRVDQVSVYEQKNRGYYALYLHPEEGLLSPNQLREIADFVRSAGKNVSVRLAPTQGIYIRNLTEEQVKLGVSKFQHLLPKHAFDKSLSCIGAVNCMIGRQDSRALLKAIREQLYTDHTKELHRLPEIRISGCRNACTLHQAYALGFEGASLKTENGTVPAYKVYIGGIDTGVGIGFGTSLGTLATDVIPEFVSELLALMIHEKRSDIKGLIAHDYEAVTHLFKRYERV